MSRIGESGIRADLTEPVTQTVGAALQSFHEDGGRQLAQQLYGLGADAVKIVRLPTRMTLFTADKVTRLIGRLATRIKPENRQLPPPRYSVPALEEMAVLEEDDTLYLAFAELLAKACDKTQSAALHPRYVKTLAMMSPVEALVLDFLAMETGGISKHRESDPFRSDRDITVSAAHFLLDKLPSASSVGDTVENLMTLGVAAWTEEDDPRDQVQRLMDDRNACSLAWLSGFGRNLHRACVPPEGLIGANWARPSERTPPELVSVS